MPADEVRLTEFSQEHIADAVALSRAAGWPHRAEDWRLALSLSHGVAALIGERAVGTALATLFGDNVATINMIIVHEDLRGQGLGRRLMQEVLSLTEGRERRLVATRDGERLYEQLGFVASGAIAQFQGVLGTDAAAPNGGVTWASADMLPALGGLDRAACGMDRTDLLVALAADGRIAILKSDDEIEGFAATRAFGRGALIGPVVARDTASAQAMLAFILAAHPGVFMRVDTPDIAELGPWLTARGLARVDGGIVMHNGTRARETGHDFKTFALASQAWG